MAIISKRRWIQTVWIFVCYGSAAVILMTIFGPNYLIMPKITKRTVSDEADLSIGVQHVPNTPRPTPISRKYTTSSYEKKVDNVAGHSSEEWEPSSINASYVSVTDEQALNFHCNVCAVVTNSGQLLGKGAGFEIDQSDCIFRMNASPTRGYENDVGSRTDVRIFGHSNIVKNSFTNNETLINDLLSTKIEGNPSLVLVPWLFHTELNKTGDPSYLMAKNLSTHYPDVRFYVSTPEWVAVAEDFFRVETGITRAEARTWLSTGWMTILFAIETCDTVDVYGMVQEQHCMNKSTADVPYHYYASGVNDSKECRYYLKSESNLRWGHKLITEKAVFARWSTRHDLNFYYPTWENISVTDSSSKLDTLFLQIYKDEPLRRRETRRQRMLKLREKFKKRYAKKRVKIVYKHGTKGKLVLHHKRA